MARRHIVFLLLLVTACGSGGSPSASDATPGADRGGGGTAQDAATGGGGAGGGTGGAAAGSGGGSGGAAGSGGGAGAVDGGVGGRGNGGTDVGVEAGPDRVDMGAPDSPADKRESDVAGPEAPFDGNPSCAAGSTCQMLRIQYADAVLSNACSPSGGDGCSQVPGALGCGGCPISVRNASLLTPLRDQFVAGGCEICFFGSPTGDRCHPVVCP
jgi:hypothetical protein